MTSSLHVYFTVIPVVSIAFQPLQGNSLKNDWEPASILITIHQSAFWEILSQILKALPTSEGHYLSKLQNGVILPFALLQSTLAQLPLFAVLPENSPATIAKPSLPYGAIS
jgi:hypothetical protein